MDERRYLLYVSVSRELFASLIWIIYYYTRKLQSGVWLIKKVGVEELDVLGEQYERPARSRK